MKTKPYVERLRAVLDSAVALAIAKIEFSSALDEFERELQNEKEFIGQKTIDSLHAACQAARNKLEGGALQEAPEGGDGSAEAGPHRASRDKASRRLSPERPRQEAQSEPLNGEDAEAAEASKAEDSVDATGNAKTRGLEKREDKISRDEKDRGEQGDVRRDQVPVLKLKSKKRLQPLRAEPVNALTKRKPAGAAKPR